MWQRLLPDTGLQPAAQHRVAACSRASAGVLDGATHVYMANLCFPEALNHAMTAALAAVSLPRARPRAGYLPATYRTVSRSGRLPRRREEAAPPALQPCAATQHCNPALQPRRARGCHWLHGRPQPCASEPHPVWHAHQVASLRCVLTLRELPLQEAWPTDAKACRGRGLERVAEASVGMSWADNVGVSFYCCAGARDG